MEEVLMLLSPYEGRTLLRLTRPGGILFIANPPAWICIEKLIHELDERSVKHTSGFGFYFLIPGPHVIDGYGIFTVAMHPMLDNGMCMHQYMTELIRPVTELLNTPPEAVFAT